MELYDPFEQIIKNYGRGIESPPVRVITALMPTGRHVGTANALTHVHNSRGGGGRATKLEVYRHRPTGSVHKRGFDTPGFARSLTASAHGAAREEKPNSKARGLMLARSYYSSGVPRTGKTAEKVVSRNAMRNNFDRKVMQGEWGSDSSRRNADMAALRGKVTKQLIFQNGMSRGRRIA